jgi:hypothetical protein
MRRYGRGNVLAIEADRLIGIGRDRDRDRHASTSKKSGTCSERVHRAQQRAQTAVAPLRPPLNFNVRSLLPPPPPPPLPPSLPPSLIPLHCALNPFFLVDSLSYEVLFSSSLPPFPLPSPLCLRRTWM